MSIHNTKNFYLLICLMSLLPFKHLAQAEALKPVSFTWDIKPILSNKCIACHGPDDKERKADLRLDTFDGATRDLGGYNAIVPGNPDDSELIYRMTTEDQDELMPPRKHGKPMTKGEIALFKRWIKQGAPYAKHWSYETIKKPAIPAVSDRLKQFVTNPIDAFIITKLADKGLKPEHEADRHTLIRRASLDLTGIQPSLEEIKTFMDDKSPGAYERLLDRLLNKPAYGERWASFWLDLARYADSMGYAEDRDRTIWAYRDWVIRAFNRNMPFDQFTIEQLAGDLLPDPTESQMIATAFHRNTMTNTEGGTIDEEFRVAAVVDRVNTSYELWMGTTMACVQCHTHKYDPITHRDYFESYAIFNQTEDNDQLKETPRLALFTSTQKKEQRELPGQLKQAQLALENAVDTGIEQQRQWEQSLLKEKPKTPVGQYVRIELPGKSMLHLAEVVVFSGEKNIARKKKATQSSDFGRQYRAGRAVDGKTNGQFKIASGSHTKWEMNPWWEVNLGKEVAIDKITVWNRQDGVASRLNHFSITILNQKRQPVWTQAAIPSPKINHTVKMIDHLNHLKILAEIKPDLRTLEQKQALRGVFLKTSPFTQPFRARIRKLAAQLADAKRPHTSVPIMKALPKDKQRETRIQLRGNWLAKGDIVTPGFPEKLFDKQVEKPNRLDFAQYLLDPSNPLTARVIVNRFWEQIFGQGIVKTSEEFGSQGELPTHPLLLDYLAVTFRESGWDVKALLKHMLASKTYRQSSDVSPEKLEKDQFNDNYSRGPRIRITAEMVRDQALYAGGLLSQQMFGKPVYPPSVKLGMKAAFGGTQLDWQDSVGEDRYRRGLYTFWRRSSPYASMATFDMGARQVCAGRRSRSNTPLQALITMNDEVYVEAAQGLARRMLEQDPDASFEQHVAQAYQYAITRLPSHQEIQVLKNLYQDVFTDFSQDLANARHFATTPIGKVKPALAAVLKRSTREIDYPRLAAWTVVANVILNQDEFFQKR